MNNPVETGLKFGVGFFVGVFILAPLLLIGGCALLISAGSDDEQSPVANVAPVSTSLLDDLATQARNDVRKHFRAQPASATCRDRGYRQEDFVPDYHLVTCVIVASRAGREVRFGQRVECFAKRPTMDACHADDPVKRS